MSLKNDVLAAIYESAEIKELMLKIQPEHIRDDLRQHVFVLLLEKPDDFIIGLHAKDKLKGYIVSIIYNLSHFKQDKFHRVHRRNTEICFDFNIVEDEIPEDKYCVAQKFRLLDHFVKNYRDEQSETTAREMEGKVTKAVSTCHWYKEELIKIYAEKKTYRAVAKETGIPLKSVYNTIQKVKKEIKNKVLCSR